MTDAHTALLVLVDTFLNDTKHQSLIDADKVRDALLDIRSALTAVPQETS